MPAIWWLILRYIFSWFLWYIQHHNPHMVIASLCIPVGVYLLLFKDLPQRLSLAEQRCVPGSLSHPPYLGMHQGLCVKLGKAFKVEYLNTESCRNTEERTEDIIYQSVQSALTSYCLQLTMTWFSWQSLANHSKEISPPPEVTRNIFFHFSKFTTFNMLKDLCWAVTVM